MNEKQMAEKIVELVGGEGNIVSVRHCATRLRIVVSDKERIETEAVEALDRVKGSFFNSGQYQIILGTGLVNRVYDEVIRITGGSESGEKKETVVYGNRFQRAIRMFSDVFVPIIPVLVATGLFMGLRGLLTQEAVLGVFGMTPESIPQNFLKVTQILTDTAFAFLPALVCWSTFRNFGGNPVIGIVLGLMLVNPALPSAYDVGSGAAEPLVFFGFIKVAGYQGSVLPAFVTGIIGARFEQWLRRHVPDAVDLIVTPFVTMLVGITLALFVLGPVLHTVESGVLWLVEHLLFLPLGIGGLLYGSFGQLLGIFGIHHILNFLEISMLAQDGWNYLNPIGTCGNVAQAGAVLAVAVKARSNKTKQVAYPSCLSALLGITEPAVFGVNLRFVKPFVMAMIGGGVGGFLASLLHLRATGMSITGIPGTLLYLNEQLPLYLLVNVSSFAVAFAMTWFFGFREENKDTDGAAAQKTEIKREPVKVLKAFVSGKVIPITEVKDDVFSSKALGDGIAIEPTEQEILAPCDGTVSMIAEGSNHAIGMTLNNRAEILLHIGLDTVGLNGEGFQVLVQAEEEVKQGQKLMTFDKKFIESKGLSATCILVLTNSDEYPDVRLQSGMDAVGGETTIVQF